MNKKIYNVLNTVSIIDLDDIMNISQIQNDGEDKKYFTITYFGGMTQDIIINYNDLGRIRIPKYPHFGEQYNTGGHSRYNREKPESKWWYDYREITEEKANEITEENEKLHEKNSKHTIRVNRSFNEFRENLINDLGLGKPQDILGKINLTKQKTKEQL